MMKMVMIAYNMAVEEEVMEVLAGCAIINYTKMAGIFGKGGTSGTHLGNDIWPGMNNMLVVVCRDEEARKLMGCVRELRKSLGKEGIKAFMMPVEDVTS